VRVISRLIASANPVNLGIAVIALLAYGFVITELLPHARFLRASSGGLLPGESYGFGFDLAAFIVGLSGVQRANYIVLLLLEVPFFFLQALIFSWAMALGIKTMRWEESSACSLLALPMIGAGADLAENFGLILSTFARDATVHWAYVLAATQLKLIATQVSLALAAFGFLVWAGKNIHARLQRQ
jgi:hypothetical protein